MKSHQTPAPACIGAWLHGSFRLGPSQKKTWSQQIQAGIQCRLGSLEAEGDESPWDSGLQRVPSQGGVIQGCRGRRRRDRQGCGLSLSPGEPWSPYGPTWLCRPGNEPGLLHLCQLVLGCRLPHWECNLLGISS